MPTLRDRIALQQWQQETEAPTLSLAEIAERWARLECGPDPAESLVHDYLLEIAGQLSERQERQMRLEMAVVPDGAPACGSLSRAVDPWWSLHKMGNELRAAAAGDREAAAKLRFTDSMLRTCLTGSASQPPAGLFPVSPFPQPQGAQDGTGADQNLVLEGAEPQSERANPDPSSTSLITLGTTSERAEREARVGRGYYSLVMASNIISDIPESSVLRTGLPSYLIWARATSARKRGWRVNGGLTRPKDDFAILVRQVHREEGSFVHLSDFVEWAIEVGYAVAPSAVDKARKACEVSDTFERRVRLWEIDRTLVELRNSKTDKTEVILARDARIAALDRERGEIIAFFQGADLAAKRAETPAANARGDADGSVDEPSPKVDRETIAPNTDSPGRREQQVMVILETATKLGYNPLAIPYGGKAKIKKLCKEAERLFAPTSFEHAWKEARSRNLVRQVDTHKYAKR